MSNEVLFEQTQLVPLGTLKPYDKNPRKGNVIAIAESLKENKQYRPIVVQKNSNKILAGNHTYKAAQHLGWDRIAVVMVDVDDSEAAKIVLADNRTNDLATYDSSILAEVLESLDTPTVGTGYSQDDLDLITSVAESNAEISGTLTEIAIGDTLVSGTPLSPAEFDEEAFGDDESITASVEDEFEDTQAQLQGVLQLQDDAYFEMGLNPYDIPPIRPD